MSKPNRNGLGYKADARDDRDFVYGANSAPALPPVLFEEPDLTLHVVRVRDQGNTGSCVGQALAAAIEVTSLAIDGATLHVSAQWLYTIAREAERSAVLQDDGAFPRLAMSAAHARGILSETSYPFAAESINRRPAPAAAVDAYDLRGFRFHRILSSGKERVEAMDDALRRGCGVLFGSQVSAAYQRNEGEVVRAMGPAIGGHMQTLVRCGPRPLVLNSWGAQWGARGYAEWDRAFLAEYDIPDIYVLSQVPNAA